MQKRSWLTRRDFVRLGGSSLLLPFLPRAARAAGTKRPPRLIIFYQPNGTWVGGWRPLNSPPVVLGQLTQVSPVQWGPMHAAALPAIADNVVMIDGLTFNDPEANHRDGGPMALTCAPSQAPQQGLGIASAISFDQWVAQRLAVNTRVNSFNVQIWPNPNGDPGFSPQPHISWTGNGTLATTVGSPSAGYQQLFPGGGAGNANAGQAAAVAAGRKSVLDVIQAQIQAVNAQLGQVEQSKLASHLAAVRQLEQSLGSTNVNSAACNNVAGMVDSTHTATWQTDTITQFLQLTALGIGCDVTSVATLMLGGEGENFVVAPADAVDDYHFYLSHRVPTSPDTMGALVTRLNTVEAWFSSQFVNLVTALKALPDPDVTSASVFDNTIVMWVRGLGDGSAHSQYSVPYVLAVGNNTGIKTAAGGRFLSYGGVEPIGALFDSGNVPGISNVVSYPVIDASPYKSTNQHEGVTGVPHQRLFNTIGQVLGVSMTGFGGPYGMPYAPQPLDPTKVLSELLP